MKLLLPRLSIFQWAIVGILAFMLAPVAAFAISHPHVGPTKVAALGMITMLDLAKLNSDRVRGLVEENVGAVPEIAGFPAVQLGAGELKFETLVRTGYPLASFHHMGEGLANSKSTWKKETFECFPFGGRVQAAKQTADQHKRGGAAALFAAESSGIARVAMFEIAQQIWYGRNNDAKGFPGCKNMTAFGTTFTDPLTGKTYALNINGSTGATANTGSSVYFVRYSRNQDVPDGIQLAFGNDELFSLPDPIVNDIVDPNDSTKMLRVYASVMDGFAGLIIPNQHSVRRIGNLSSDSGKGLTWALMDQAWASWPQGIKPDAIYMSARSQTQLQANSTVTLMGTGTDRPAQPTTAPLPVVYNGVPIIVTDAIADNEAIEVAAASEE